MREVDQAAGRDRRSAPGCRGAVRGRFSFRLVLPVRKRRDRSRNRSSTISDLRLQGPRLVGRHLAPGHVEDHCWLALFRHPRCLGDDGTTASGFASASSTAQARSPRPCRRASVRCSPRRKSFQSGISPLTAVATRRMSSGRPGTSIRVVATPLEGNCWRCEVAWRVEFRCVRAARPPPLMESHAFVPNEDSERDGRRKAAALHRVERRRRYRRQRCTRTCRAGRQHQHRRLRREGPRAVLHDVDRAFDVRSCCRSPVATMP